MESLAPIKTIDELKKLLFIQRTVTQAAKDELLAFVSDDPQKFIARQKRLLEKYANYPTLSEFADEPALTNAYKWGATFGVATLVGALILEEVRTLQPHFATVLRQMFFLLLKELDHPEHEYLNDPLVAAIQVTAAPGTPPNFIRHTINKLVETFVMVATQYGLMTSDGKQVTLTPVGKRILLHLADTAHFIEAMGKAHKKFQAVKPKSPTV